MKGLTHENCDEIGFVVSCFICGAINRDELRGWAEHIMVSRDEYPLYIVDLYDFNDSVPNIYEIIGFIPSNEYSPEEEVTFDQLAFDRHGIANDNCREADLDSTKYQSANLLTRFKEVFSFIPEVASLNSIRSS